MIGKKKLFLLLIISFLVLGCTEEFLHENPPNIITADNLYVDYSGFQAGVYSLYNQVRQERAGVHNPFNMCFNQIMLCGNDIMSSNFPAGYDVILREWGTFNNPTVKFYQSTWEWLYGIVNAANTIVERANQSGIDWTKNEKNDILAQTRLIRAWAYRHLTGLWGDVPLNLEETTSSNIKDWQRTPIHEVYAQMESDLSFAERNLSLYPENDGKIAKGVATHYLAELYLTMGDYERSISKADSLINSGVYSLITERYGVKKDQPGVPFMDMFYDGNSNRSEGNTETLWTFQYEYLVTGGEGPNIMRRTYMNAYYSIILEGKNPLIITQSLGGRGLGRQSPTHFMLRLFEKTDHRGSEHAWRWFYTINNPNGIPDNYQFGDTIYMDTTQVEKEQNPFRPSTRKWDDGTPADNILSESTYNDQVYLRLAETYLILAEAQLKAGDINSAAETLNVLRSRSNASPVTANDISIDFILDERARELFCEEHRRYSLLRNQKWLERTRLHNAITGPNITERDTLLPIPQSVIDANLNLKMVQNPGY